MFRSLIFCLAFTLLRVAVAAEPPQPTSLDDLRDWHRLGLPLAAEWNVNPRGYDFHYHVRQVREGHRFLPSVRFLSIDEGANDIKVISKILTSTKGDFEYLQANRLPLCLRTNNIVNTLVEPRYRLPKTPASVANSPLVWTEESYGMEDRRFVDVFGPVSLWEKEGRLWGASLMAKTLEKHLPDPAFVLFIENNEGADDKLDRYLEPDRTRRSFDGGPALKWKSLDNLAKLSLRMHDRVQELLATNAETDPNDFRVEYWTRRRDQRLAFYDNFKMALEKGWSGPIYLAGYNGMHEVGKPASREFFEALGYTPELAWYDAGSMERYANSYDRNDFTSLDQASVLNLIPAWEVARSRNPRSYRELSLRITGGGALAGALAGKHEVMTPARYEGFVQWLLWSIRDAGVPVLLRHWCKSIETPKTPWFDSAQRDALDKLGAPELKAATCDTYLKPIISAVDRICNDAILRRFWLEGRPVVVTGQSYPDRPSAASSDKADDSVVAYPRADGPDNRWRLLECSENLPRDKWEWKAGRWQVQIRVWGVATRLGDEALVLLWSPCQLEHKVTVRIPEFGQVQLDAPQPWGYWIVRAGGAAEPLTTK
jgi:hypothetical protein